MSATNIDAALAAIDAAGLDRTYLSHTGGVTEGRISEVERELGINFPSSYRYFLKTLGQGDFEGIEFLGLFEEKTALEKWGNAYRVTLELRKNGFLPDDLFAVKNFEGDAYACLHLTNFRNEECPVILWDFGESVARQRTNPHILACSFGEYFFNLIEELIHDARE
jgi:hypothetical protein|tara:strand:- start:84 stop:581 length:498 start_codon:yes stop_codon:yes gene_type:complete